VGGTAIESGWLWTPQGTVEDYWKCQIQGSSKCPTDFLLSKNVKGSVTESVWKEDWALAAGGGGISTIFSIPQFQSGLDSSVQKLVNGYRAIPDLSLNAAINGGVQVYMGFIAPTLGVPAPTWQSFGGTSCASPETAGLIALAGEEASKELNKPVGIGSLNPILYSLNDQDYNDIVAETFGADNQVTIDNNALYYSASVLSAEGSAHVPPVAVPGFQTTKGYDLATGLGTPRALNFVLDVAHARVVREGN